jgi:hypothetical protein
MNETVQALADLLAEKAPIQIRIAADTTTENEPEAAHFLKFNLNGDERRMGRDLELYSFMVRLSDDDEQGMLTMLLEEWVLPIKSYSAEAFTAAIAFMRERGAMFGAMQTDWNNLLDSISKPNPPEEKAMQENEVVDLMASSTSAQDWDDKCLQVKKAFAGNYPPFWYKAILATGLAERTLNKFGETAEITIAKV